MDDSQELLSCSSLPAAQSTTRTQVEQTPVISTQESFRFDFEDLGTQTQVLDEDGWGISFSSYFSFNKILLPRLLKVKSSQSKIKSKSRRQLLESSIQGESVEGIADDDAPWAMCSGRFTQGEFEIEIDSVLIVFFGGQIHAAAVDPHWVRIWIKSLKVLKAKCHSCLACYLESLWKKRTTLLMRILIGKLLAN